VGGTLTATSGTWNNVCGLEPRGRDLWNCMFAPLRLRKSLVRMARAGRHGHHATMQHPHTATPAERFDLHGRVAIVTGGSRGLGREMVLGLAGAGADVVIASRKLHACRALADDVRAATGRRALPVAAHVGRWNDIDALVETAYQEFGRVDVLVNNAGMSPLYPEPAAVSEALWDKVLAVNLKAPFRLTALVGPRMEANGGGSIINVSSIAATHPRPDLIPYAAAKAGVNALTLAYAHLWRCVRVNCIVAGPFLTDVSQAWDMEAFERRAERFALRRAGQPEEIVGAALYLASDASSFTTGALLSVDGGYR
jgi:NAD(P)-dependent dehydrogenase (short-subunit alcohol dehydrogenase family)